MALQVSYPGVYIQELKATGPIEGVGTSTAAFLGPARNGEPNKSTLITSFDEFRQRFDNRPLNGFYLWYAVRGFFENGGRRAHIVRVSTGDYARWELLDSREVPATPETALTIRSRELGAAGITVTVEHSFYVNTTAFRPQATIVTAAINTTTIQVMDDPGPLNAAQVAAQFRAGDQILVALGAANETATVRRVTGAAIVLEESLSATYNNGTVHLVNLQAGDRVMRVASTPDGHILGPGSVITIQQGAVGPETAVVASMQAERIRPDLTTYRVELESGLTMGPYDRNPAMANIDVISQEFTLQVNSGAEAREHLSMARNNPRYFSTILAANPFNLIVVEEPDAPSTAPLTLLRPAEINDAPPADPGAPDDPTGLATTHYQTALDALREVETSTLSLFPTASGYPRTTYRQCNWHC